MASTPARRKSVATPKRRDREVLEAAARVFHERSYATASVQEVADELGILKASLYHYIDSKEELLFRLLDEVHEEVQEILDEVKAVPDLDPIERLTLYTRRQVEYNAHNLAKISVYYHDVDRLGDARRAEIFARRKVHERFVVGLIRQAQAEGLAQPSSDPRVLANLVFATIIWLYRWYRPDGRLSPENLGAMCAGFVQRGIAAS